jgi:AcrR family transcriptional regulator
VEHWWTAGSLAAKLQTLTSKHLLCRSCELRAERWEKSDCRMAALILYKLHPSESEQMANSELVKTQQRIINAATDLFSKLGYNGVSTRDIARVADVNETSIYRYYPRKRDLFIATLDAEFSKVRLRADLIAKLSAAPDAHAGMLALFRVIMDALLQQHSLVRLLQFSVLEFGGDLDDLYRRHIRQTLDATSEYLARWPELAEAQRFDTRITILGFIATLVALRDFYPVLTGEELTSEAMEKASRTCAELWHAALVGKATPSDLLLSAASAANV